MKTVSVVMCTYNGEVFLREQLDSIVTQTHPIHELIIQDDCSTDHTAEIVTEYAQRYPYIRFHRNTQNLGFNRNFQDALSKATGDFVAIADQDDIWYPEKIQKQAETIGGHDICISAYHTGSTYRTDGSMQTVTPCYELSYLLFLRQYARTQHVDTQGFLTGCIRPMGRTHRLRLVALGKRPFRQGNRMRRPSLKLASPSQCFRHDPPQGTVCLPHSAETHMATLRLRHTQIPRTATPAYMEVFLRIHRTPHLRPEIRPSPYAEPPDAETGCAELPAPLPPVYEVQTTYLLLSAPERNSQLCPRFLLPGDTRIRKYVFLSLTLLSEIVKTA